jgi:hypothetical protein
MNNIDSVIWKGWRQIGVSWGSGPRAQMWRIPSSKICYILLVNLIWSDEDTLFA